MRNPDGKNADRTPNRGQHVPVIAQANLKLALFLFHHWWRCTFDWEVMGVCKNTVHLLAGQKRIKDKYKDPDMLPKVNKVDMAGRMESIKECLRSHHGVMRVPPAYVFRRTIPVQMYGDYPKYATPDDK